MKISYITIGTNNREAAEAFYDQLLKGSGFEKAYSADRMTMWVREGFMFALAEPFDGNPATIGNGSMFGLSLDSEAEVKRLYNLAIALGGTDEGPPAIRSDHPSAYVRDLDGNKLCFFA